MSVNAREQWELEFVSGLVGAGNENMKLTGGDDDRRQAMWNIANPIIKAIKRGVATIHFVGSFSVTQLNALQSKEQNGIYGVTDDGLLTNPDGTTLQVTAGSSVMWDGSWREFLDIDLSGYYTKEQVDSLIATAVAEFTAAVANESSLRESADATLQGNIDAEASERSSADNALDERVAYLEEATSSYEVNSNKVNAIDDSTTHYPTTHAVTAAIGAEAAARESADSALGARIDGEETAREQADGELQAQIDAISSRSDVVDVVASYAELVAYDTSSLADNDVVKVLADETHEDAITYYRWGAVSEAWSFIGSQGPYYTISETDTLLAGKVDKVTGKGLSTNDYTTAEKNKLAGIEDGAQVNNIFVAVYTGNHNDAGNTPYADIYAAYQAGKRIMCWNGNGNARRLYTLNGFNSTDKIFKFTSCGGSGEDIVEVTFQYLAGNINNTECRTNNYLLAKRNHASSDTTYGTGTSSNYGHVKLSASTSSTSGENDGVAATPSAVKAAYDFANGKADKSHASSTTAYGTGTSSNYGHVKLSDSTDSTSGASDGVAATPRAVKNACELANSSIGHDSVAEFGATTTAVGIRVMRIAASSSLSMSSFLVRITNRNSNDVNRFGEIYAILSVSHRSNFLHMSFTSLTPKRFNGVAVNGSSLTPVTNSNSWRCGYRKVTSSGNDYYEVFLWAVNGNTPVTIPFTNISLTSITSSYDDRVMYMDSIDAEPDVLTDYWDIRYFPSYAAGLSVGSGDRPAYVNDNGEVSQGNLVINRGSHSTITLDFSGTAGSASHTVYFV